MAWVFASTNPGARAGAVAMAILSAARSFPAPINQHQTRRGAGSALRPSTPAAVNQLQDWSCLRARAGFVSVDALTNGPVRFSSSRRAGHHLRGRADLAAPRVFHSCAGLGSRRSPAQSVSDQHLHKLAVRKVHHLTLRLSSVRHLVGIDPNEIGLTHAQISFAPGANEND